MQCISIIYGEFIGIRIEGFIVICHLGILVLSSSIQNQTFRIIILSWRISNILQKSSDDQSVGLSCCWMVKYLPWIGLGLQSMRIKSWLPENLAQSVFAVISCPLAAFVGPVFPTLTSRVPILCSIPVRQVINTDTTLTSSPKSTLKDVKSSWASFMLKDLLVYLKPSIADGSWMVWLLIWCEDICLIIRVTKISNWRQLLCLQIIC